MTRGLADKRVLIVEDEFVVALNVATEVAARGGVVIGPVATVEGALEAINNTDVDGAILNFNLRGRVSLPVADALAERHVPFVFATGYEIPYDVPARHMKAAQFEKPTAPGVICCAIEAAMSARGKE